MSSLYLPSRPPVRLIIHVKGITNRTNGEVVAEPSVSTVAVTPEELAGVFSTLDSRLHKLYEAVPPRTALVIFTGHSDPRRMASLNARKSAFDSAIRSGKNPDDLVHEGAKLRWTTADARLLEEEVERAKRGLLFLGIKDGK